MPLSYFDPRYPGVGAGEVVGASSSSMRQDPAAKMSAKMSYVEIYNETIRDLLTPSQKKLALRESDDRGE